MVSKVQMHQARKLLWSFLLVFAVASFAYKQYQNSQVISDFSAQGVVIKVQKATEDKLAFIEVVNQQGQLKRLTHKNLLIPKDIKMGDHFIKQAGSPSARINDQLYLLQ